MTKPKDEAPPALDDEATREDENDDDEPDADGAGEDEDGIEEIDLDALIADKVAEALKGKGGEPTNTTVPGVSGSGSGDRETLASAKEPGSPFNVTGGPSSSPGDVDAAVRRALDGEREATRLERIEAEWQALKDAEAAKPKRGLIATALLGPRRSMFGKRGE